MVTFSPWYPQIKARPTPQKPRKVMGKVTRTSEGIRECGRRHATAVHANAAYTRLSRPRRGHRRRDRGTPHASSHGTVALSHAARRPALSSAEPIAHDRREVQVHLTADGERCLSRLAELHKTETQAFGCSLRIDRLLGGALAIRISRPVPVTRRCEQAWRPTES